MLGSLYLYSTSFHGVHEKTIHNNHIVCLMWASGSTVSSLVSPALDIWQDQDFWCNSTQQRCNHTHTALLSFWGLLGSSVCMRKRYIEKDRQAQLWQCATTALCASATVGHLFTTITSSFKNHSPKGVYRHNTTAYASLTATHACVCVL